jgi:phosphatidate cytidylyltransferase
VPQPRREQPRSSSRREPTRRSGSDLFSRILVGVPAAFVAIVLDDIGGLVWTIAMIGLGCACMNELYRLLGRWKPVPLVGFAAVAGMCLVARYSGELQVMEVAVAAVPVVFLAVAARNQEGGATVAIAGTLLGIYWIGLAFAHAVLLRQVGVVGGIDYGKSLVIDVMVGTFVGDTAAYVGGRMFGRRPLAPTISPSKTVEGLFFGMFAAILSVFIAGLYQPWLTHGEALLLGVAIALLGPLGDLFESLVKRDAGAKDAGTMFGAHGGALDRLDAIMFTIVAAYFIWIAASPH